MLIRSERNLGFAGGNNLGIGAARGDYLLLLNNDAFVEDGSLRELIAVLENDSRIGCVSPEDPFCRFSARYSVRRVYSLSRITLRNSLIGFGETRSGTISGSACHSVLSRRRHDVPPGDGRTGRTDAGGVFPLL